MKKEIYFVVTEEWFDERENPAYHSQVVDVYTTLEEAQESMDIAFADSRDELVDWDDVDWSNPWNDKDDETFFPDDYTPYNSNTGRAFYRNDNSLWYECGITKIEKIYDDNGVLEDIIKTLPTLA